MTRDSDLLATIPPPSDCDAPQPPGTHLAGAGDGGWLHVACVISGDTALGYLCDGRVVGEWLSGTVEGDRVEAEGPDGSRLEAQTAAGTVRGTATAAGYETVSFEARPPTPGAEGLYRAENDPEEGFTLGWIVFEERTRGLSRHADGRTMGEIAWGRPSRSSRDAIAVARAAGEAFGRAITHGEIDEYLEILDPDVEFETASAIESSVRFNGHADVREYLERAGDQYAEVRLKLRDIRDIGGSRFFVVGRWSGRSKSGNVFGTPLAAILTIQDGRVTRLQGFMDEENALEAARSSEAGA